MSPPPCKKKRSLRSEEDEQKARKAWNDLMNRAVARYYGNNGRLRWPEEAHKEEFETNAIQLAKAFPSLFAEKYFRNGYGHFPLYYACVFTCSLQVIKAIHLAYPKAIDVEGDCVPVVFALAVKNGECPVGVIEYLVESFPGSLNVVDRNGGTPLHLACRILSSKGASLSQQCARYYINLTLFILRSDPKAARRQQAIESEVTPLACLLRPKATFDPTPVLVNELIRAAPTTLTTRFLVRSVNVDGSHYTTPIAELLGRADTDESTLKELFQVCPDDALQHTNNKWTSLSWEQKWKLINRYCWYMLGLTSAYTARCPLHSVVRCRLLPDQLAGCIERLRHELLQPDQDGCVPLHVALKAKRVSVHTIVQLVEAEPRACTVLDPSTNQFPVETVASMVNTFDNIQAVEHLDSVYRILRVEPVKILDQFVRRSSQINESPQEMF